jgi:hypothetical protein
MTTSLVDAESVLAVDLGSQATRALLFDVVDGQYSFIAEGSAPSTLEAPYRDIGEGVSQAIMQLQTITGRGLLGNDGQIILPSQASGAGVDRLVLTYSAGPTLKVVITGLLNETSLASAQRLVGSTYARVMETIGMNDRRRPEVQIDAILQANPDLVIIAGGTEGGASRSVYKLVDLVNLACRVLPKEQRPEVLYAGNQALAKRIKDNLSRWTTTTVVPNIRPSIDMEDLRPAQYVLNQAVTRRRVETIPGMAAVAQLCSAPPSPSAAAFSRLVGFLSRALDPAKGVLGVDVGNASTVFTAGSAGSLATGVFPFGMGRGAGAVLQQIDLNEVMRWLPIALDANDVRDALWQKTILPNSLPHDLENLALDQAFARVILRLANRQFLARYPEFDRALEPVLVSGGVFSLAPTPGQALLMLLDGLEPVGVTTFVLDQNNLGAALGAIASFNPVLPVQVMESGALLTLGTVICPLSDTRGTSAMVKAKIEYERGNETSLEVAQGSIALLPLQVGQAARVSLQGLNGALIDPRSHKHSLNFKVVGGACGTVIDARNRPLNLPQDDNQRRDLLKKWALSLGG